jgi:hypothetical protein
MIEGPVDATTANGVHWGSLLALIAALCHFPEVGPELDLLGFEHNANPIEGQLNAPLAQMRQASESLALNILLSVAHDSLDDIGGE